MIEGEKRKTSKIKKIKGVKPASTSKVSGYSNSSIHVNNKLTKDVSNHDILKYFVNDYKREKKKSTILPDMSAKKRIKPYPSESHSNSSESMNAPIITRP